MAFVLISYSNNETKWIRVTNKWPYNSKGPDEHTLFHGRNIMVSLVALCSSNHPTMIFWIDDLNTDVEDASSAPQSSNVNFWALLKQGFHQEIETMYRVQILEALLDYKLTKALVQYIPYNMHSVSPCFTLLWSWWVSGIIWFTYPYPSGLRQWQYSASASILPGYE